MTTTPSVETQDQGAGGHTPGPWDLIAYPDGQAFEVEGGGCIMALVHYNDGAWTEYSEAEANARLIASAPKLLTAAERALNYIENTESELGITLESGDMLRSAIAKARGRQ